MQGSTPRGGVFGSQEYRSAIYRRGQTLLQGTVRKMYKRAKRRNVLERTIKLKRIREINFTVHALKLWVTLEDRAEPKGQLGEKCRGVENYKPLISENAAGLDSGAPEGDSQKT